MEPNTKVFEEPGRSETSAQFFDPRADIETREHRLPHWQQGEAFVFVTWRLADSLPLATLQDWQSEKELWLRHHPQPWDHQEEAEYHRRFDTRIERWLDLGTGSCLLRKPVCAKIVRDALLHWDGERYEVDSFVVMPNHVHILFQPITPHALGSIVKAWKGFTAREINRSVGMRESLWQDGYWDRLIRSEEHLWKCREYIRRNPEKAGIRDDECVVYMREDGASGESS